MPLSSAEIFEDPSIYSVDSDQTASIGAVWSGSTLYASTFILTNKQTFFGCSYFAGVLMVNSYDFCLINELLQYPKSSIIGNIVFSGHYLYLAL